MKKRPISTLLLLCATLLCISCKPPVEPEPPTESYCTISFRGEKWTPEAIYSVYYSDFGIMEISYCKDEDCDYFDRVEVDGVLPMTKAETGDGTYNMSYSTAFSMYYFAPQYSTEQFPKLWEPINREFYYKITEIDLNAHTISGVWQQPCFYVPYFIEHNEGYDIYDTRSDDPEVYNNLDFGETEDIVCRMSNTKFIVN